MIFYVVVRLAAWMWGISWPLQHVMARRCAVISAMEIFVELVVVASLGMCLFEGHKKEAKK